MTLGVGVHQTIGGTRLASYHACDDGGAKTKLKFALVSQRFDMGKIWLALKVVRPAILHAIVISKGLNRCADSVRVLLWDGDWELLRLDTWSDTIRFMLRLWLTLFCSVLQPRDYTGVS